MIEEFDIFLRKYVMPIIFLSSIIIFFVSFEGVGTIVWFVGMLIMCSSVYFRISKVRWAVYLIGVITFFISAGLGF